MHGSDARQHEIAATLSKLARQELRPKAQAVSDHPEGSDQARGGHGRAGVPLEVMARPAGVGSGVGVWVVGLDGLEPSTSSSSGDWGDAARPERCAAPPPSWGVLFRRRALARVLWA